MKFEYKIEAGDFLEFQLFTATHDAIIQKRKKKGWTLFTIVCIILATLSFLNATIILAIYFAVLAVIIGFFYPRYFKWRYKKQYGNFIIRNYNKRFGEVAEMEITKDHIFSKDNVAQGKVKIEDIQEINETPNHFFIKIKSGISFILPKYHINPPIDLKAYFSEIGVPVKDALDWKW